MVRHKSDRSKSRSSHAGHGNSVASMTSVSPDSSADAMISALDRMPLEQLCESWVSLFRRLPPKGLSRRLLEHAAAYSVQMRIHGGLKPTVRRKLLQAAPLRPALADPTPRRKSQRTPSPGSRLVREWHGHCHTVEVTDRGFLYGGRTYRSLSEVARAITGARWSGPRFFGL
jgi:hypothetical protein